jgi:quaternary ammonium compound-resistance protein SugE
MGLKFGWTDSGVRFWPLLIAAVLMLVSGIFLLLAQRTIPVGTAYAVWTGIGAVGTFFLGILLLGEAANVARFCFFDLIIVGIVGLKLASFTK